MNSYRCMKLKLSRRGDGSSDSLDQAPSNPGQTGAGKDGESRCESRSTEVQSFARFSTRLDIEGFKSGGTHQGLPGLCHVTPPPSPLSGGEQSDGVYKELCIFEAKGTSEAQTDITRPFLSPATTDEEDTHPARPKTQAENSQQQGRMRGDEVLGMDDLSHGDASRKGDIFKCSFCERTFSYLCHLKVHERVHTGEKPYSCKFCSTQFSQLGSLTVHMRIHTGEKPYQCRQCSKRFRHINSLRRHQRQVHTGDKRADASPKEQQPLVSDKAPSPPQINQSVFFNPYIQRHSFANDRTDSYAHKVAAFKPADTFYAASKNNFCRLPMSNSHCGGSLKGMLTPEKKVPHRAVSSKETTENKTTSIFKSIEHLLGLNEHSKNPHRGVKELKRTSSLPPTQKFDFTQPWGVFGKGSVEQVERPAKLIETGQGYLDQAANIRALNLCTKAGVLPTSKKRSHSDDGYSGSDEDVQLIQNDSADGNNKLALFSGQRRISKPAEKQRKLSTAEVPRPIRRYVESRKWSEDSGIAVSHYNLENHIVANA